MIYLDRKIATKYIIIGNLHISVYIALGALVYYADLPGNTIFNTVLEPGFITVNDYYNAFRVARKELLALDGSDPDD